MMKTKLIGTATAIVLAGAVGFGPGAMSASAAPNAKSGVAAGQPAQTVQEVTGTLADGTAFTGAISNLSTSVVDGVLTLTGSITGSGGITDTFTATIENVGTGGAACDILTLDLGPLFLDLLGLQIDLAPINLAITAVPGAGNLLGNLLCAVAGLLDGPGGALNGVAALLNRLLTGLGL